MKWKDNQAAPGLWFQETVSINESIRPQVSEDDPGHFRDTEPPPDIIHELLPGSCLKGHHSFEPVGCMTFSVIEG